MLGRLSLNMCLCYDLQYVHTEKTSSKAPSTYTATIQMMCYSARPHLLLQQACGLILKNDVDGFFPTSDISFTRLKRTQIENQLRQRSSSFHRLLHIETDIQMIIL